MKATENEASSNGSEVTSPTCHERLASPLARWRARACSIIAGVRSMPVTWRACPAKSHARRPGPQATSRIVSPGPMPAASRTRRIDSSVEWAGIRANGMAWRVN